MKKHIFTVGVDFEGGVGVSSGRQIGSQIRPEFQRIAEVGADTQECSVHQRGTFLGLDCFMIPFSSVLPHGSRFRTLMKIISSLVSQLPFVFHPRLFLLQMNTNQLMN